MFAEVNFCNGTGNAIPVEQGYVAIASLIVLPIGFRLLRLVCIFSMGC